MRPMLATSTDTVPVGDRWAHEVKWDGMRLLTDVSADGVRLFSRTERDVTAAFPELLGLAAEFADMLLDGEVVCLRDGVPSFSALADRIHVTDARRAARLAESNPVTLMAFDLIRLYGVDLTARSWVDRRRTLERLELNSPRWQTPPTFTDGAVLYAATKEQGLEGVVSKRVDSAYLPGRRSAYWLKAPHRGTISVVIGGWRPESTGGVKGRLGAVLVGVPGPGGLRYLGRVGSGLAGKTGSALMGDLSPLQTSESPFGTEVPREDAAGAQWVHPLLVADVQSLGLSGQGRLRQPAYKGLRADLTPADLDDLDGPSDQAGGA
ncbi:DNA ligase [Humibacillus sp. DSM 29435]|uniref:non-homologous end-joining DNA ligase n=1 Tax=Humibacillus sp. DSM 29435 TaxID=1869167 RepID=UPI0008733DC5|nr:non-homologous end-joining DNA ligase [Humibacillus sp. DSM 29435]OFE18889.1 DNA ligase [Humibacillus sp. DSM 29435]